MTLGYKSKYRNRFKRWALSPANKYEQMLGIMCIAFGAVIGLEIAIVALFNAIYWGL